MHATTRVRGAGTCNNTCEGNGTQAVQSSRPLHQPLTLMGVKEGEGGHASSAGRSDPRVSARACWGRVRPCQAVAVGSCLTGRWPRGRTRRFQLWSRSGPRSVGATVSRAPGLCPRGSRGSTDVSSLARRRKVGVSGYRLFAVFII